MKGIVNVENISILSRLIEHSSIKIVSFDIFDTLIFRPVIHPRDIFYFFDKYYQETFDKTVENISNLRIDCENELIYREGVENVTIDSIYEELENKFNLDKDQINMLKEKEISLEIALADLNSEIFSIYKKAKKSNKKIIFTTDIYLPSWCISKIINKFDIEYDALYVSADIKKRKDNGSLFDEIIHIEEIHPFEMLHIGDNIESDFLVPLKKGIVSFHYIPKKNCNKSLSETHEITSIFLGYLLNKENSLTSKEHMKYTNLYDFAYFSLGPCLLSMMFHLLFSGQIQNSYDALFFSSRDGYLPFKVYELLRRVVGSGVPGNYVYCGRRALDIANYTDNALDYIADSYYKIKQIHSIYTIKELFKSMNLNEYYIDADNSINYEADIRNYISDLNALSFELESRKAYVAKYLNDVFSDVERGVIFDCGYSGSVSDFLCKLTKKRIDKIYMWENKQNKIIDKKNITKTYLLFQNFRTVQPFNLLFEELFSPLESACIGFIEKNGEVLPVFDTSETFSDEMKRDVNTIHDGVINYVKDFCWYFEGFLPYFDNVDYQLIFDYTMKHLFNEDDESINLFSNIIFHDKYHDGDAVNSLADKLSTKNRYNPFKGNVLINPDFLKIYRYAGLPVDIKLGFHIHLYYIDICIDFIERLKDFPYPFDLYITITDEKFDKLLQIYFSKEIIPNLRKLRVILVQNRGRDIGPWLIEMKDIHLEYDLFGHFHTKKNDDTNYGEEWRRYLFDNLLEKNAVIDILNLFHNDENLGILYPPVYNDVYIVLNSVGDPPFQELDNVKKILSSIDLPVINNSNEIPFSVGTMFWYRPLALKKLFYQNLLYDDFPQEPIGINGTLAHAIERMPSYIANTAGYSTKIYINPDILSKIFYKLYYNRETYNLNKERSELIAEKNKLITERNILIKERDNVSAYRDVLIEKVNGFVGSRSWRITRPLRKLVNFIRNKKKAFASFRSSLLLKIFPLLTKRRFLIKILLTFFRSPFKFIDKLTAKNIRLIFYVFKKRGTAAASRRINELMNGNKIPDYSQKLHVFDVNEDLIEINDYEPIIFNEETKPVVSIVIPVYNNFHYTYFCLKSIFYFSGDKIKYEIIIANDCSTDLTKDIESIVSNITVVKTPNNMGFLKNCNYAAKYARGDYVLFLNNDTQVQFNWLLPLVELIEKDEFIGAVGSRLIFENGLLQEAGGIIWNDGSAWNYGRTCDPALSEFNYVKEVDYISGAALMIRKSIWEKLGGFDEKFAPAYCEDSDICFSMRQLGYKVMYQPDSLVVHFEGITNGTNITEGQKRHQIINQKKLYVKWKNVLKKEHFPNGENVFFARDRSKNKKTLLMIDHYVPQYDKDAGSKTVLQYIQLFLNIGFNVKFIGDNFHRYEPYTGYLEQMGIEVLYGTNYATGWRKWLETNGMYIDYVFLNRPHVTTKYIDIVKLCTRAKLFYYGHDLRFLREQREYKIKNDKDLIESSNMWRKIELEIMSKVDVSYFPSQVEVDEIKKIDYLIKVKSIPAYLYESKIKKKRNFENTMDIMFIGGFVHNPNTDGILWYSKEIYPILKKLRPEIKTYILGSNPPKEILNLNDENIIVTGFITDQQLNNYYGNCRLSVVPLRYGAGIKGKVVEAMYNQIPVVTTSVGAEGIVGAEDCLFIKDDPQAFAEEIARVYDDFELLAEISISEIDLINRTFTPEVALKIISNDFD